MNYLKVNLLRLNISQRDLTELTGINKDRINRLYNLKTERDFQEKCYLKEFNTLKKQFDELEQIIL